MIPKQTTRDASRWSLIAFVAPAAALVIAAAALPATASAATVTPPKRIAAAGKINFCSDMTSPPIEFLTPATKPEGSDIDIGNAIAQRLGVQAVWHNIPFKGLIPALLAQQCDVVISQLFDKPAPVGMNGAEVARGRLQILVQSVLAADEIFDASNQKIS